MRKGGGSLLRSFRWNALCSRRKSSLGKPLVEIESKNIVAVGGHTKVGVGLAGSGSHDSQQLVLLKSMNSLNRQRSDSCLLAFRSEYCRGRRSHQSRSRAGREWIPRLPTTRPP